MSLKRLHPHKAPQHGQSLVDEELESRSNLVVPKNSRQKKKDVEDPTLGSDMTERILRTAANQMAEEQRQESGKAAEEYQIHIPSEDDEEKDNDEDGNGDDDEVELMLETNDDESRALFEMFKDTIAEKSKRLDKNLSKTRHQADPKIREVYTQLGSVLRIYKSGKLPKAVNVVASQSISDWEELLELSNPQNWSLNAIQAVSLLFVQSASDKKLTVYIREFLLEYIRDLLERSKSLPKQIWSALKHCARRTPCFVNGLLIPLSQESKVSQKEARVISAILLKVKLQRDHANAFIIKVCESEISPVRTIIIGKMISKNQALAIQAVDAILAYFLAFMGEDEAQPVLWHKALLDYIKFYGKELTYEQRDAFEALIQKHNHKLITPEIRKILEQTQPREDAIEPEPIPIL